MIVEVERGADLLDDSGAQHHDPVGQRHRLHLIVGDEDHGRTEPTMELVDLDTHLGAQLRVEVGQRFVEQEYLRLAHDCPADRHPLALAARELARPTIEELADLQDLRCLGDARRDFLLGGPHRLKPEREVLAHRHVRVQRVGLEHHGQPAFCRGDCIDPLAVDHHLSAGNLFEPGDHAQKRRLPASRRTNEDNELAVHDLEVHAVNHLKRAEPLDDLPKFETRHHAAPGASRA